MLFPGQDWQPLPVPFFPTEHFEQGKKVVYPTLASVHTMLLVARTLKDASAVTVFLRKPRAALNTACLRQAARTGVFYNTFAIRMPADKGAFKVSPARVIAQSGHALPNVGPRRFACGR